MKRKITWGSKRLRSDRWVVGFGEGKKKNRRARWGRGSGGMAGWDHRAAFNGVIWGTAPRGGVKEANVKNQTERVNVKTVSQEGNQRDKKRSSSRGNGSGRNFDAGEKSTGGWCHTAHRRCGWTHLLKPDEGRRGVGGGSRKGANKSITPKRFWEAAKKAALKRRVPRSGETAGNVEVRKK